MVPASVMWRPATIHPKNALWQMVQDSHRWLRSLRKLTPLRTRVRWPSRLRKRMPRNYDNGGKASHRPRRHGRCGTLRPMRMAWRVALGVALVRSSTTS